MNEPTHIVEALEATIAGRALSIDPVDTIALACEIRELVPPAPAGRAPAQLATDAAAIVDRLPHVDREVILERLECADRLAVVALAALKALSARMRLDAGVERDALQGPPQ